MDSRCALRLLIDPVVTQRSGGIMKKLWFALCLGPCFSGCAPTITSIDVTAVDGSVPPMHGAPIAVATDILVARGGAGVPEVLLKPYLQGNEAFQEVGTLPQRTDMANSRRLYRGEISPQNYGGYEMRLRVPYSAWLTRQYVSKTLRFSVGPPDYCFGFITDAALGFTASDVFLSDGTAFGDANLRWRPQNWPFGSAHDGSASIQILANEFPRPPVEEDYWFVDFVSGPLDATPEWAQSRGIVFNAAIIGPGVYAQPILHIRDAQTQQLRAFAPFDNEAGTFLVYAISTSAGDEFEWRTVSWQSDLLPEGVLEKVHVRIYGDADAAAVLNEVTVYLDSVCPIPPGIGAPDLVPADAILNPWQ